MKRTVYLSDDLDNKVTEYLQTNPPQTLSNLVQEALEIKLASKDISQLLELAGIVKDAPKNAMENAEDYED